MTAWIINRRHPSTRTIVRIALGALAVAPLVGLVYLWLG